MQPKKIVTFTEQKQQDLRLDNSFYSITDASAKKDAQKPTMERSDQGTTKPLLELQSKNQESEPPTRLTKLQFNDSPPSNGKEMRLFGAEDHLISQQSPDDCTPAFQTDNTPAFQKEVMGSGAVLPRWDKQ